MGKRINLPAISGTITRELCFYKQVVGFTSTLLTEPASLLIAKGRAFSDRNDRRCP